MSTPEESYRALVQQYLKNGTLSAEAREALENNRLMLRLLPDQAQAIEQELLRPAAQLEIAGSTPDSLPKPRQMRSVSRSESRSERESPDAQPSDLGSRPGADPPDIATAAFKHKVEPTIIAPYSADYPTRRDEYKEVLRRAYLEDMLTPEVRAELSKLAQALGLSQNDEAAIEDELNVEFVRGNSTAGANGTVAMEIKPVEPGLIEPPPAYDQTLQASFETLEQNLKNRRYEAADQQTHDILLKVVRPAESWLDVAALSKAPQSDSDRAAIQAIDRLWREHSTYENSTQKFGFGRQLAIYGKVSDELLQPDQAEQIHQALLFSQKVDWWIEPLKFYKFYFQLNFTSAAEYGHLPAYWFWQLPRRRAFELGGFGILPERGGCRVDASTLPEFMRMLRRSGIKPVE
jgi:GUN4-like